MAFRAQFRMVILALHLVLDIHSTWDFSLVQALAQDLLLQCLLKVTIPLEHVGRSYL